MIKTETNRRRNRAARAYLAALDHLIEGKATHSDYAGRPVRITPAAVPKETRRSRNPLYTTHSRAARRDRRRCHSPHAGRCSRRNRRPA